MNDSPPLLIYDGRCSFCKLWIQYWKRLTGDRVTYAASQDIGAHYPEISPAEFQRSVWLVYPGRPDRPPVGGARAVCELMSYTSRAAWMTWLYRHVPPFAVLSEAAYRFVADHRNFFYWVTRIFWGKEIYPATYRCTRSLFLKGLAAVFLIAFLSLAPQITGLIGTHGISPVSDYLNAIRSQTGSERYWELPSLAWINSSDVFLRGMCWAGGGLAVALLFDFVPLAALLGMIVLYLSLMLAGQDFLSFQWDALLLETGFAAMLLAPRRPGTIGIWVLRLLIFRLMLESGLVKLLSGDPSWRSLSALSFHYETQPLPSPLAWYAHQLPVTFQKLSTVGVFIVELFVPLLFLMPRRFRIAGAWITICFQLTIAATGNYTFFNLLTIVLCLTLLDDQHLQQFVPRRWRQASPDVAANDPARRTVLVGGAILITLGLLRLATLVGITPTVRTPLDTFHVVNNYGLFAVMTTSRPEIVIEGSNDGENWQAYEFKYKPGDVNQAPRWVAPYQPRLDWQMWFAALSERADTPWFTPFMKRLLEGSPEVLGLLAKNPFPDKLPLIIRGSLYDYHFADAATRRSTGAWWTRTYSGPYFPAVRLR